MRKWAFSVLICPIQFCNWHPTLSIWTQQAKWKSQHYFRNSKAHGIVFNSSKPGSYQLVRSIAANMSGRTYFRTFLEHAFGIIPSQRSSSSVSVSVHVHSCPNTGFLLIWYGLNSTSKICFSVQYKPVGLHL